MSGKWFVHVIGPDEIMPFESKEAAEKYAQECSEWWATYPKDEYTPHMAWLVTDNPRGTDPEAEA